MDYQQKILDKFYGVEEKVNNTRNTDFYNNLPGIICAELEDFWVKKLENKEWFLQAWNEYREHILSSNMDDMRTPYSIFKNYLSEEEIKALTQSK